MQKQIGQMKMFWIQLTDHIVQPGKKCLVQFQMVQNVRLPKRQNCQWSVGLVATFVCQRSAPKVIVENLTQRCYTFHILIVYYCLSVVKYERSIKRVCEAKKCQGEDNRYSRLK